MNKRDLIPIVAEAAGITHEQAKEAIDVMLSTIADALRRREDVNVRGFGGWRLRHEHTSGAVNPRTGEQVAVEAELKPYFKPGRRLLDFLAE